MILEEATKEAFGYFPSALTHGSHKHIVCICDYCRCIRVLEKRKYTHLCKSCWRKIHKHTEETKEKISKAHSGKTFSKVHKKNIAKSKSGTNNPNFGKRGMGTSFYGKHHTKEAKAKISAAQRGKKTHLWRGGISFEPYCIKFNNAFKDYIRSKFEYTCFLCPKTQAENGKKLSVHHVNYNKDCGCDGDETCNFVPLCKTCHSKTNGNRDYWQALIMEMLKPLEAWE